MELPHKVFQAELLDLAAHRTAYGFKSSASFRAAADAAERVAQLQTQAEDGRKPDGHPHRSSAILRALLARVSTRLGVGPEIKRAAASVENRAHAQTSPGSDVKGETEQADAAMVPSTHLGLVGLALSGGGIRSATFNLGLLQAFGKCGLLDRTDYLSTVSGGGYIGCCLSSLLTHPAASSSGPNFPLQEARNRPESLALSHLRNTGNYLAPGGILDRIRIPALLVRGILINMLIFLPYVLLAVVLTEWGWGDLVRAVHSSPSKTHVTYYRATLWVSLLLAIWIVLFPVVRRSMSLAWSWRDKLEQTFAAALTLVVAVACVNSLPVLVLWFYRVWSEPSRGVGNELRSVPAILTSLVPFLFARKLSEAPDTWRAKAALYFLGVLAPLILFFIYLRLASDRIFQVDSSIFRNAFWAWVEDSFLSLDHGILALGLVLFLFAWIGVDVNLTSLHGFYRDRLSKAYLFTISKDRASTGSPTLLKENDEQLLSALNPAHRGPYHLINATVNLQGRSTPEQRGRKADFFVFAKHFSGSTRTAFCRTADLERSDARLDLATAMAISGAAMTGNMGTSPIRSLVLIMTLLNVRTGYWLPNPRLVDEPRYKRGLFTGVGPWFLLREFLGLLDEKSRYVNVSDGGHLENLGLYELLRRRCRFIVVCDAESDKDMAFGGLATVMRYARIDLGIEIRISLQNLRRDPGGMCTSHYSMGEIHYPGGQNGHLLYIKASLTGDESVDILEYRNRNPRFPHQSTAQQFFDEAQFEAYRQLGYHVAECLLPHSMTGEYPEMGVSKWFQTLEMQRSEQGEEDNPEEDAAANC